MSFRARERERERERWRVEREWNAHIFVKKMTESQKNAQGSKVLIPETSTYVQ